MISPPKSISVFLLLICMSKGFSACVPPQRVDQAPPASPASLPEGVAAGDVDQTSAVLWAHSDAAGPLTFTVSSEATGKAQEITATVADPQTPVTVTVEGLTPGTRYAYSAETATGDRASGVFRTAAGLDSFHGLRFGVSGDWQGGLAPFVALGNAPEQDLAFFVALGDTIYADLASPAVPGGPAQTLDEFRRKYAEVYALDGGRNPLASLRASTALYVTIDDHEVLNDFAGGAEAARDSRFPETEGRINDTALYEQALQAFQEYHPLRQQFYGHIGGDGRMDGERRLYRYRTFGQDAAIFLLDARSFRDLPLRRPDRDDPADIQRFLREAWRPERTMLAQQQLADLQRDLLAAQQAGSTWKFILIPEPIQQRGLMSIQDRFEGYAAERNALLAFIDQQAIENVVFISADIHGTQVNNISYQPGPDAPAVALPVFEITTGPVAFDPTLGPVVIIDGIDKGYVSEAERATYEALPIANDGDSLTDDRDDFVKAIINRELRELGYDELGLDDSPLDAALLAGDYVALHSYGWTEFDIAADSQALTVTTYGIPPYSTSDLARDAASILARKPQVVSQFEVRPR